MQGLADLLEFEAMCGTPVTMVCPKSSCPRIESRHRGSQSQADAVKRAVIWKGHDSGNKMGMRIEQPRFDFPMREDGGVESRQNRTTLAIQFKRHLLKLIGSRNFLQ